MSFTLPHTHSEAKVTQHHSPNPIFTPILTLYYLNKLARPDTTESLTCPDTRLVTHPDTMESPWGLQAQVKTSDWCPRSTATLD